MSAILRYITNPFIIPEGSRRWFAGIISIYQHSENDRCFAFGLDVYFLNNRSYCGCVFTLLRSVILWYWSVGLSGIVWFWHNGNTNIDRVYFWNTFRWLFSKLILLVPRLRRHKNGLFTVVFVNLATLINVMCSIYILFISSRKSFTFADIKATFFLLFNLLIGK